MSAHTPTPWELDGTYLIGRSDDGRMLHLADFARPMSSSIPLGKANAALAHKAVNLHDVLVRAVQEVATEPRTYLDGYDHRCCTSCGADLHEGEEHGPACSWAYVDAAIIALREAEAT